MHDEILMNIMLSLNGIKDILYKTAPWYQSLIPFITAAIGAFLAYLLGQHKDKVSSKKEQIKIKRALFHEIMMLNHSANISFITGCDIMQKRIESSTSLVAADGYGIVIKAIFYENMFHDAIPELNDEQIEAIIYLYSDYETLKVSIDKMNAAIKYEHHMIDKYNYDIVFYSAKILNSSSVILNNLPLVDQFSILGVADSIGYKSEYFEKARENTLVGKDK